MSEQQTNPTPANSTVSTEISALWKSWRLSSLVAGFMIILALIGVGLTTTNSRFSSSFWIWLTPVYGILCIGTAWSRGSQGIKNNFTIAFQQFLHWLGVGVAIMLDFVLRSTGEETSTTSGLSALLILSLGCFLAGVHLEWLFAIVGILLTLTLFIVAKAVQYQWVIFVVGGILLVGLFGWHRIKHRYFGTKTGTTN
jgi:hypothetical protein